MNKMIKDNNNAKADCAQSEMGPALMTEVERQLLIDLKNYKTDIPEIRFDWSSVIQNDHSIEVMDGTLESVSNIKILDIKGGHIANGVMDFVYLGKDNAPAIFWLSLQLKRNDSWSEVLKEKGIPGHVWNTLSDSLKKIVSEDYAWRNDPLIIKWKQDNP